MCNVKFWSFIPWGGKYPLLPLVVVAHGGHIYCLTFPAFPHPVQTGFGRLVCHRHYDGGIMEVE